MNNKGQALVEFILILPVFIMILFVIVDFGMIISTKSSLENRSTDIIEHVKKDKSEKEIKDLYKEIEINIDNDEDYIKVILTDQVNIMTPGLNRVLGDPYIVKVERFVYND